MTKSIPTHECYHIMAAAAATVELANEKYADAETHFHFNKAGGEVATTIRGASADTEKAVAALTATAPVVGEMEDPTPEALFNLFKHALPDTSTLKGYGLSDKDVQIADTNLVKGPARARIALAAKYLSDDLGIGGWHRYKQLLGKLSREGLNVDPSTENGGWPLSDLVPLAKAKAAHKRASEAIQAIMDPAPNETPAENAERLQAKFDAKQAKAERLKAQAAERAAIKNGEI